MINFMRIMHSIMDKASDGTEDSGGGKGEEENNAEDFYNQEPEGKEKGEDSTEEGKKSATGYEDKDPTKEGDDTSGEEGEPAEGDSTDEQNKKVDKTSTGYDENDDTTDVDKDEDKDEDKDKDSKFGEILKELDKEEATNISKFAKEHKMTEDQIKAYVEMRKKEMDDADQSLKDRVSARKRQEIEQKASWNKELKEDVSFGGENFAKSVTDVDKVLNDFMPGMKNKLTEGSGMLPPYVMKDLAKLAKHLYGTDSLVNGDPSIVEDEDKEISPLDFYV